jgi:hypothetical protein
VINDNDLSQMDRVRMMHEASQIKNAKVEELKKRMEEDSKPTFKPKINKSLCFA